MAATELKAYIVSCDYPGCDGELVGFAGDDIGDVLGGTTWGAEDGLHFCYDHFDTESIETARATPAKKGPTP